MTNSCYQQLDNERKRRVTAMQTLVVAENSNTDLKKKLTAEEQARKSAESALDNAEGQAESQRKLTREARDGNFYPIRGYPARPDPNGPGFTRSV